MEVQPARPSPAFVSDSRPRRAVIKAAELSWLSASCDGKQIFEGLLAANVKTIGETAGPLLFMDLSQEVLSGA